MSVPFIPRAPAPPIQMLRQIFGGNFFYMVYFQEPGVADADLGARPGHDDAPAAGGDATVGPTSRRAGD